MALEFTRIEVRKLVKLYGATRALAGVSLDLQAGEITAIEGHNGSGKSTLLSILALAARPTRGSLRFGRLDPLERPALRGRIGLVGHAAMVYPDLTGRENLALTAQLYGLSPSGPEVQGLDGRFELGRFMERPARTYSRGQLQRLSLARALLHAPQLLLLDEPSTGLDVKGVERLTEAVRAERERGAIVLLVTHSRALSEALADRRVVLDRGRVVSDGDAEHAA
ncbi:MAG: ABC transporter ATP-binding protein [Myxococcales bacterium]|nr:ABC transporter ATP-binding protein [Myxococcales bacterium]